MWWVRYSKQVPIFKQRYGSSTASYPPEGYETREFGEVVEEHPLIWWKKKDNQGSQLLDWKELSEADIVAHKGGAA
jgi:hypothetical protein